MERKRTERQRKREREREIKRESIRRADEVRGRERG